MPIHLSRLSQETSSIVVKIITIIVIIILDQLNIDRRTILAL